MWLNKRITTTELFYYMVGQIVGAFAASLSLAGILDSAGKGNGTLVIAGCVDLLKLSSTVQGNITTALADDGQALDRIIFVKGSAI